MEANNLTDQEILFCELYVTGDVPFTGNAVRCYQEVFNDSTNKARYRALKLLHRDDIKKYIEELGKLSEEDAKSVKAFLTANLKHIIEECSSADFVDRRGNPLSPAAMRSVAVSASKTLMEMYPVKEAQTTKVSIDNKGESGVTFNVIIPTNAVQVEEPKQTDSE